MEVQRPAPGEELNRGAPTEPRQAASVIVLRGGSETLELLLLRRNPEARFMGGVWVFPGGAVDPGEDHREAALREVREEAGLALPAAALVPYSRWITPAQLAIRFDTHFFLAAAPPDQEVRVDGEEMVGLRWDAPAGALASYARGELELVLPTIKQLEQLAALATADELLASAAGREIVAIEPRVLLEGDSARLVLPGEPGYDD
jgi:8-oxo-dGTP pyrophosphatase MutT (NUDIX family)